MTNLVSQNTNGAGGGHLMLPKPQGSKSGGGSQDKSGCYRSHKLTEECDLQPAGLDRAGLDPGPHSVAGGTHYHDLPHAPVSQHPHNGQDKGEVREEIHHCQAVNRHAVGVVEAHDDVAYAAALNPHVAVAHGVQAEDEEHDPSALE